MPSQVGLGTQRHFLRIESAFQAVPRKYFCIFAKRVTSGVKKTTLRLSFLGRTKGYYFFLGAVPPFPAFGRFVP